MLQRLITWTVWMLVGWTATGLVLRLLPQALQAPPETLALAPDAPAPAKLERLFGAVPVEPIPTGAPAPAQSSRFQLLGVVAPRDAKLQSRQGVALLAVDGGPAKSYRVGQVVDGELKLLTVQARTASLGREGLVQIQLQLPDPPAPAVGTLPSAAPMAPRAVPVPSVPAHPIHTIPSAQPPVYDEMAPRRRGPADDR